MLPEFTARVRSLWRGVRGHADVDADMQEEFRLHMELRAADFIKSGLAPAEARRRARLEFGSTEHYKAEGRESRGLRPFDEIRMSWLDFKLGFRMLSRYPGLTLVGGLAMAFAIWMGAATFELVTQVLHPTIPLDEGDRIVGLRMWDAQRNRAETRVVQDFTTWRGELRSVEDLGAFRTAQRNLIVGEGQGEPIEVAEISASAFRVTRTPPLFGRTLMDADEQPGAPPVAVIGYGLWQARFGGDSTVVGRTVRLGRARSTIVGVMPEGFLFPIAQSFWIPLRLNALDYRRREGPSIRMFGRLASGFSLDDAQAELTRLSARAAADFPETHEHLRGQVMSYPKSIVEISTANAMRVASLNIPVLMLLVLICANVALLLFARAATRESEIAVRNALGASRGRIIMQLFAEALVLGGVAAVVGLAAAEAGLRWVMRVAESEMLDGAALPFWFDGRLSPATVLYAAGLTVLAAIVAGVVPAFKVTRGVGNQLKQASAGAGGVQFGGIWTAVIVIQVALTVAFPAVAFFVRRDGDRFRATDVGFPEEQYLSLRLEMDREPPPGLSPGASAPAFLQRYGVTLRELEQRLTADPAVAGVTFANRLPRMYHPHRIIEVDEGGAAPRNPAYPNGYRVSDASVAVGFFDVLSAPIRSGRDFRAGDLQSTVEAAGGTPAPNAEPGTAGARGGPVVVNESFHRLVLGDRNPIGRRIRYVSLEESEAPRSDAEPGPWYEIVGVVKDMATGLSKDPKVAQIYHPVAEGGTYPARIAVHVKGDPLSFAPQLRAIATATDPTLRIYDIAPLNELSNSELRFLDFWFRLLVLVSGVALILSLAGIYAVMAFTVARRTREIGIRVALGASQRRVIIAVFKRPLLQVAIGILVGAALTTALMGDNLTVAQVIKVAVYAVAMVAVCALACIVPTRRALRVEPTEALRSDG